jgi:uncharacterized protein
VNLIRHSGDGLPAVRSYGGGGFRIGNDRYEGGILVSTAGVLPLPFAEISGFDIAFARLIADGEARPDILFVGTGTSLDAIAPETRDILRAAGIAVDCMATGAACRTYNVALGEGRRVAALLIAVP